MSKMLCFYFCIILLNGCLPTQNYQLTEVQEVDKNVTGTWYIYNSQEDPIGYVSSNGDTLLMFDPTDSTVMELPYRIVKFGEDTYVEVNISESVIGDCSLEKFSTMACEGSESIGLIGFLYLLMESNSSGYKMQFADLSVLKNDSMFAGKYQLTAKDWKPKQGFMTYTYEVFGFDDKVAQDLFSSRKIFNSELSEFYMFSIVSLTDGELIHELPDY